MIQSIIFVPIAMFFAQSVMPLDIVSRNEWGANRAKSVDLINKTVPYVIFHHSFSQPFCDSSEDCVKAMQRMQRYDQVERGCNDISYQFAVGGDGKVYEGRGFNVIGAHAPGYNSRSIGICFIGDYTKNDLIPTNEMSQAIKDLINFAVEQQYLSNNYTLLFGRKKVSAKNCPGEALYNETQTWPNFDKVDGDQFVEIKENITDIIDYMIHANDNNPMVIDDIDDTVDKKKKDEEKPWHWWQLWRLFRYYWSQINARM